MYNRVSSLTNLDLSDIFIKSNKVKEIGDFLREILRESQKYLDLRHKNPVDGLYSAS